MFTTWKNSFEKNLRFILNEGDNPNISIVFKKHNPLMVYLRVLLDSNQLPLYHLLERDPSLVLKPSIFLRIPTDLFH